MRPNLLDLQRSVGNAAVTRALSDPAPLTGSPPLTVSRRIPDIETLPGDTTRTPRQQVEAALASRDTGDAKAISDVAVATEPERLELIRILLDQVWVGPSDEAALERLWGSFGRRLPQVAGAPGNLTLWEQSLDRGAELNDLPAIVELREAFGSDVKAVAGQHLTGNRSYVTEELQLLGGGAAADPAVQAAATESLQQDARLLARAEEGQAALTAVQVGYDWDIVDGPGGSQRAYKTPATFNPAVRPMAPPTGQEDPALPSWESVNAKYQEASDVIRGLVARNPALHPLMGSGQAGQVGAGTPAQARALVTAALTRVLADIDRTLPKIDSGDLDWRDLRPIHAQLFSGAARGVSGTAWDEPFSRSVAHQVLEDHATREFWIALGLASLAAAAFVVAGLATAGSATFFLAATVGVGAAGLQAGMSWEQYEDLATASTATVSDERALVTSGQASAALLQATLDTVFLFLDVYGVAARVATAPARAGAREALAAGERSVGERATREAAEAAERRTAGAGERVAEETLQAEAQAAVRAGDASHTLKVLRRDGHAELWFCTNCARLIEQVDTVLPTMPRQGDSLWALERLERIRTAAVQLQNRIDQGLIPFSQIPGEVNQLAERLRYLFAKYPAARGLEFFRGFQAQRDFAALAERLGYTRAAGTSHGQPIYRRGNRYISPDIDGHNGGVWKVADRSAANLRNRDLRTGTFNEDLSVRIGD